MKHDTQRVGLGMLLVVAWFTSCLDAQEVSLPMSPTGQVWAKQVPTIRVAAMEFTGDPFAQLDRLTLTLNKFTAKRGAGWVKPLVVEFPDLDWRVGDPRPLTIFLSFPEHLITGGGESETILYDQRDGSTVASVSFKGAYTAQNATPYFEQLATWIQTHGKVITGKPRLLFYDYRSMWPKFTHAAELQQPIR